jgi:hypothetical protein
VELRGIDPGHKYLEEFEHPFELKILESGEDRASWQKWTSSFAFGMRLRGFEFKMK